MTREEAIRLLKTYRNCLFGILTEPIDMAIKALERQDKLQRALDMEKGAYNALVKNIQCEDAISRQAVLETLDNMDNALDEDRTIENYKELLKECYEVLPLVNLQEPCDDVISRQAEQFARWVAKELFDDIWEDNPNAFDGFAELACRKLEKLGFVRANGGEWELVEPQEGSE